MTTFKEARAFLPQASHRLLCGGEGISAGRIPCRSHWALDWFDAELGRDPASKDRVALWIVDAGSDRKPSSPSPR